jgi:hypothetical protein
MDTQGSPPNFTVGARRGRYFVLVVNLQQMPVGSDRQRITCLPERAASVCALKTRRMCFCRAYRKLRREVEKNVFTQLAAHIMAVVDIRARADV